MHDSVPAIGGITKQVRLNWWPMTSVKLQDRKKIATELARQPTAGIPVAFRGRKGDNVPDGRSLIGLKPYEYGTCHH